MLEPPSAERNKLVMRDKLIEMCLDFVEPTGSAEELNKYTNEHLLKLIEEVLIAEDLSKTGLPTSVIEIDRLIERWRASGIRFDYNARRLIDRWHAGEIDRPTFLAEILRVAPVLADLNFGELTELTRKAMEEKDLSETDITAIDNTYSEDVGGALADDVLFGGNHPSDWDGGDADKNVMPTFDSSWFTPAKRW